MDEILKKLEELQGKVNNMVNDAVGNNDMLNSVEPMESKFEYMLDFGSVATMVAISKN